MFFPCTGRWRQGTWDVVWSHSLAEWKKKKKHASFRGQSPPDPGCIWDWPGDAPTGMRVVRQSGPKTWRSPGLSHLGAQEGQVSAHSCFWKLPDNQSLSTHCWPRVVWLRNTFKQQHFHTTWPGQLWTILIAEEVGRRGVGPRAGQGEGTQGKEMGADPRWRWSLLLSFYGPVVISWRAPLTGLAMLRPKLHVHPLVSPATLDVA